VGNLAGSYIVHMLRPERLFPRHLGAIAFASVSTDSDLQGLKAAVLSIRMALSDIESAIDELERREAVGGVHRTNGIEEVSEVDPLIYRVDQIRVGCEEILRRSLSTLERNIVMSWANLERDGQAVPVTEILDLTRYLLSRPTPDGTLPSTLKWCEATVQTLARAPVAAIKIRGGRNQATELASLYEEMADRLESAERGR
jgi:hypothetical protein